MCSSVCGKVEIDAKEGNTTDVVNLERNCVLWIAVTWQNNWSGTLLSTTNKEGCNKSLGKSVVFHHENSRPYRFLLAWQKLGEHEWEILMDLLYSPVPALSDYQLFQSLQGFLNGFNLISIDGCEMTYHNFSPRNHRSFTVTGLSC